MFNPNYEIIKKMIKSGIYERNFGDIYTKPKR